MARSCYRARQSPNLGRQRRLLTANHTHQIYRKSMYLIPVLPQRHRSRCTWAWPGGPPTLDSRSRCGMALLDNYRKSTWSTTDSGTCGVRCACIGTKTQANPGGNISNTYNDIFLSCILAAGWPLFTIAASYYCTTVREAIRSCQVTCQF